MKKMTPARPFFFKAGKRAVLLLHGFTGTSADVRILGRYLEKNGYTSLAPHYKGHGVPPEQLIQTGPTDWWQDVVRGYEQLREEGYNEIAVGGLSLGGVFSLQLAMQKEVVGVFSMCAPMTMKTTDLMFQGVLKYARDFKRYEGKSKEQIEEEVTFLAAQQMPSLRELRNTVYEVKKELPRVQAPLFAIQGKKDTVINTDSVNVIYTESSSEKKEMKWYEESGHVITLGPEKQQVNEDIVTFLNGLNWTN